MTDLKITAEVVGSEEEKAAEQAAICFEAARGMRALFMKLESGTGPSYIHFNYSQDQIELQNYMLTQFAYSKVIEGDELAKEWAKLGWQKLGPRVSWRMTPSAIEFALASGHRYCLRKAALRNWYDGKGFPVLEKIA